jgi:hypothetical protein
MNLFAETNVLRSSNIELILQSETEEELDVLLPSVLDKAFNGEL